MYLVLHNELANAKYMYIEVRASQLAQASERVGSLIPASQQGCKVFNPVVKLVLENQPFLVHVYHVNTGTLHYIKCTVVSNKPCKQN